MATNSSRAISNVSKDLNKVVDIDWKFGVTASSSEQDKVGLSYLHMKLVLQDTQGELNHVFLEMSLPQFYSFLYELEKAKTSLDLLT